MGMSVIVEQAIYEIKLLADNIPDGKHIVTGDKTFGSAVHPL